MPIATLAVLWPLSLSYASEGIEGINSRPASTIGLIIAWFIVVFSSRITPYCEADPAAGRVKVRTLLGFWRVYPGRKFERLEFCPLTGGLYEVAQDGRRHRVPFKASRTNLEDWHAFVHTVFPDADLSPVPQGSNSRTEEVPST